MNTYLYRLSFKAPVHFGAAGIGLENTLERLPSDSLTSALINAFSVMGEADGVVGALLENTPPFVLSSLFPFGPIQGKSGVTYALPCPLMRPPVEDWSVLREFGKDLKRIRYLVPQDFFSWIGDASLSMKDIAAILERSRQLGVRWDRVTETGWWAEELRPRVALDRDSQNSNIWFCGSLRFHEDAGLFGLVSIRDERWKGDLGTAFRLLGDLGLGGERTYGMGTFEFSGFEPIDAGWAGARPKAIPSYVLLSSYYPADEEGEQIAQILDAWDFIENRGYVVTGRMATTLKRKRIGMIAEGSVVKRPVVGKMVDVSPDHAESLGLKHRVYRSGLAFVLPEGGVS